MSKLCLKTFSLLVNSMPDPIAWWKMEESGLNDRVDAVNSLVLAATETDLGTVGRAAGKIAFGATLSLTGLNDTAGLGPVTTTELPDLTSGISVVFWAKWTTSDPNNHFTPVYLTLTYAPNPTPGATLAMVWEPDQITLTLSQFPDSISVAVPFAPTPGTYYFFHAFWDAADSKIGLQINNAAADKSVLGLPITIAPYPTSAGVTMDLYEIDTGLPGPANILIDEYAVYGTLLDSAGLATIYNSSSGQTWPLT